jgi:predicted ATP-dependent serine protease
MMVKEVEKKGKVLFICEECGLAYEQKEWAEKCQQWCRENQSCNLEIIRHSVPQEQPD